MIMGNDETTGQPTHNYVPTQPYEDKRGLELPRITVPPPNIDYNDGLASFHVPVQDFEHADTRCGNPQFLRSLVLAHPLTLEHKMMKWNYASRRLVQPILPYLLLGPSTMARDTSFVQSAGVTFLLAIRSVQATSKHPKYLDPAYFPSATGLRTATFDLDTPYELITNIRPVVKSINDHLQTSCSTMPITSTADLQGKVMLFCESGNERSATVVAAYLMIVYGIGTVTAIQIVQSQRFCINVDDGMKNMLLALEDILTAERGVMATRLAQKEPFSPIQSSETAPQLHKPTKRSLGQAYESDDDMSDTGDWPGEENHRAGVAPFADASLNVPIIPLGSPPHNT